MKARAIIMGVDLPNARGTYLGYANAFDIVAVASPRSLSRLRGVSADTVIYTTEARDAGLMETTRIIESVAPCLAARKRTDAGTR